MRTQMTISHEHSGRTSTYPGGQADDRTDAGSRVAPYLWATTRLAIGFTFLWAFVDKTFGLGYATPAERAWIEGGSPTSGFLGGVEGPFDWLFTPLAGQAWADWLFMGGLLGIGLALILGVALRIAAASGALLLIFGRMAVLLGRPPRIRPAAS